MKDDQGYFAIMILIIWLTVVMIFWRLGSIESALWRILEALKN